MIYNRLNNNFKSANVDDTGEIMFKYMEKVIKYQKYLAYRYSNWESFYQPIPINLSDITRLYFLEYNNNNHTETFKMIARMDYPYYKNLYVDFECDMVADFEDSEIEEKGKDFQFPGCGNIFVCSNVVYFMSIVLGESMLIPREQKLIFDLLQTDNIYVKKDVEKYINWYRYPDPEIKVEYEPAALWSLCEDFYVNNKSVYKNLDSLYIPKQQIENLGKLNRFKKSLIAYIIDR